MLLSTLSLLLSAPIKTVAVAGTGVEAKLPKFEDPYTQWELFSDWKPHRFVEYLRVYEVTPKQRPPVWEAKTWETTCIAEEMRELPVSGRAVGIPDVAQFKEFAFLPEEDQHLALCFDNRVVLMQSQSFERNAKQLWEELNTYETGLLAWVDAIEKGPFTPKSALKDESSVGRDHAPRLWNTLTFGEINLPAEIRHTNDERLWQHFIAEGHDQFKRLSPIRLGMELKVYPNAKPCKDALAALEGEKVKGSAPSMAGFQGRKLSDTKAAYCATKQPGFVVIAEANAPLKDSSAFLAPMLKRLSTFKVQP